MEFSVLLRLRVLVFWGLMKLVRVRLFIRGISNLLWITITGSRNLAFWWILLLIGHNRVVWFMRPLLFVFLVFVFRRVFSVRLIRIRVMWRRVVVLIVRVSRCLMAPWFRKWRLDSVVTCLLRIVTVLILVRWWRRLRRFAALTIS